MTEVRSATPFYAEETMVVRYRLYSAFALLSLALASGTASATEVRVSAKALERTLRTQLFTGVGGRFYIQESASSPCFVYASDPHVSFRADRIVVQVKTRAKLGTSMHGSCLGRRALGPGGGLACS